MSKTKSKKGITRAVKAATEPVVKEKTEHEKYAELKSLSVALVSEVDNIFSSPLQPDHQAQLLGTVIKSFSDQLENL